MMTKPSSDIQPGSNRQIIAQWFEDFGRPDEDHGIEAAPSEQVFLAADLASARQEAWNEGYLAACRATQQEAARAVRQSFVDLLVQSEALDRRLDRLAEQNAVAIAHWLADAFIAALPSLSPAALRSRTEIAATLLHDTLRHATRIEISGGAGPVVACEALEDAWHEVERRLAEDPAPDDLTIGWPRGGAHLQAERSWADIRAAIQPLLEPYEPLPEQLFHIKQVGNSIHV
jgi:hypothetical protein